MLLGLLKAKLNELACNQKLSRHHIRRFYHIYTEDKDFALADGLLPAHLSKGKIGAQIATLAAQAELNENTFQEIMAAMISKSDLVEKMVLLSFLNDSTKRNYFQLFQGRFKQLSKV